MSNHLDGPYVKRGMNAPLQPYRVEWRADLQMLWTRIRDMDGHDTAAELADECLERWGGYVRIISQHVIEVRKA